MPAENVDPALFKLQNLIKTQSEDQKETMLEKLK